MIEDSTSTPTSRQRIARDWRGRYASRLAITDFVVLVWVVFGVQIAWFGLDTANVKFRGDLNAVAFSYSALSIVLIGAWMAALAVYDTREYRVIGTGTAEYKLLADATLRLFGLLAIAAFLFHIDIARGYILIAFPLGLLVLIASRWIWRQWLSVQRQQGRYSSRAVLVGSVSSVEHIARELQRQPTTGYLVVGACIATDKATGFVGGTKIPVYGSIGDTQATIEATGADTVIITSADDLPPNRVRELSWGLEPGRQHLVVAPSLTDIGGPRIHTRPVAGLPLIHVETPRYDGRARLTKRAFDVLGSAILILLASPLFVILAIVVKSTSSGPVFYRQQRVGLNGRHFKMLKFRSMHKGADAELTALLKSQGTNDRPLFKVQSDERVTPIGRTLRKYSLDEIPQLINVLKGEMSLVGPRPQRDPEVALYDDAARRRLLLKPGMSGLWQVSGRSSMAWEDAIRLDLYYVENWSITGDIIILARTVRAVLVPGTDAN